jgi:hypothetical protein
VARTQPGTGADTDRVTARRAPAHEPDTRVDRG